MCMAVYSYNKTAASILVETHTNYIMGSLKMGVTKIPQPPEEESIAQLSNEQGAGY